MSWPSFMATVFLGLFIWALGYAAGAHQKEAAIKHAEQAAWQQCSTILKRVDKRFEDLLQ